MKKSIIALSITSALVSSLSFAEQVVEDKNATLMNMDETIVITANRSQQDKFNVLAAVDVFDRDSIEKIQPQSIADLLKQVAGISITTQGTQAHKTSVFVRGSNSDHVLILVNGVRVGSATLGSKEVSSIPVQLIERVEVVRGPRAALWGSDAMGGVIQIFTRQLDSGEVQLGAKLGNDKFWQAYGALGFGNEQHKYTLSGSAEAADGFDIVKPDPTNIYAVNQIDDDGFNRESIALNGLSKFNDFYSLELDAQLDQGTTEIDANTDYSGDENDYKNHHIMLRNHLQFSQAYLQLSLSTSTDKTQDNYQAYHADSLNSLFQTDREQVSGLVQIPLTTDTEISLGGEWYNEKVTSNQNFDESKRDANSLFITGRHSVEQIKLEASVRRDEVGDIDSEITYQLGLGYEINESFLIALSHGTAFKAPSFNDLYYPYSGNPDLISETAENTEILARFQSDIYSVELSVFSTDYENLIEWAQVDPDDPYNWRPSNVDQATIKGVEATFTANIFSTDNRLTLSHIDAENDKTGQQLARRPHFSGNYSITYPGDNWDVSAELNHQGSRPETNGSTLSSYTLLNLSARFELTPKLTLLAKITNAGDKSYQQANEYNGAERGYTLGVDYRF